MSMDQIVEECSRIECDVLGVGGGTAGPRAALEAKLKIPNATVVLLEKANVKRSGSISMGMDGLDNAVIPGHATPEQYTREVTIANDGIVNQKAVLKYAERCYGISRLSSRGARQLAGAHAYLRPCVHANFGRACGERNRAGEAPTPAETPWISPFSASSLSSS
jgi:succinate dehydrogenase/fumarate reductase flavoprotein subunit